MNIHQVHQYSKKDYLDEEEIHRVNILNMISNYSNPKFLTLQSFFVESGNILCIENVKTIETVHERELGM